MIGMPPATLASKKTGTLCLVGGVEKFRAVLGQQRLVGGDDDLAALDGAEDQAEALVLPPMSSTMIWIEGSSIKSSQRVVSSSGGDGDAAVFLRIAHGDFFHHEFEAEPLPEQGAILRQVFEDTCADIAHSCESYGEVLHAKGRGISPVRAVKPE